MKKPMKRKPKPSANEVELRRWCIEMATKWPQTTVHRSSPGGPYGGMGGNYSTSEVVEADVIGRADRLLAWVNR